MNIETERIIIRDFTGNDVYDLQEILGDAETMKHCEPAYSLQKTAAFLEDFCIRKKAAVAAVHKESRKLIGYILFHQLEEGEYEIGWFFNRHYWGQGYAFEACKAVMDEAFSRLNARRIFAETTDPTQSVSLMKKLGMKPEPIQLSPLAYSTGNRAVLYVYGMNAEEWLVEKNSVKDDC